MSKIIFDNEDDRRIEYNRLKMNIHNAKKGQGLFSESDFRRFLFTLGLMDCEYRILPEITGEPYKPYYSLQGEKLVSLDGEEIKDYSYEAEVTA